MTSCGESYMLTSDGSSVPCRRVDIDPTWWNCHPQPGMIPKSLFAGPDRWQKLGALRQPIGTCK